MARTGFSRAAVRVVPLVLVLGAGLGVSSLLGRADARRNAVAAITTRSAEIVIAPVLTGDGFGSISSNPPGLSCVVNPLAFPAAGKTQISFGTCEATFTWPVSQTITTVTLIESPQAGSAYTGFEVTTPTGSTISTPLNVLVSLYQAATITFDGRFIAIQEALTVSKSGIGSGTVTSSVAGLACGTTCTKTVPYGTQVTLTAIPDAGATFMQWTGACNGQGATCTLTPKDTIATNAVFGLASTSTVTSTTTSTVATTTTTPRLDAQLVAVKVIRSKLGARLLAVELSDNVTAAVSIKLQRSRVTLVAHDFTGVPSGDRVLTVPLPQSLAKGSATLAITVTAPDGSTRQFARTIAVPKNQ